MMMPMLALTTLPHSSRRRAAAADAAANDDNNDGTDAANHLHNRIRQRRPHQQQSAVDTGATAARNRCAAV